MYAFLDKFFFIFHALFIAFSLFGWTWKKTRRANLAVLFLIAGSWFVLGIWYGIGYCPCTDWHWQVRMKLGHYDMPTSYVKFLIDSITGLDLNAKLVDILTLTSYLLALAASVFTNLSARKQKQTTTRLSRNQTRKSFLYPDLANRPDKKSNGLNPGDSGKFAYH
ncbi:MAG: DUF2784 domain-containing protein [candidate division KSB1 bacterium]|nr:DUF2784 domain-containing protein [candidate division KSB1 bacterium]MDZ7366928.1 DUF2784 domain-containing protein [candidate division KSB1 bacterium]MDZ7406097.1 DUF2784 domain-containing protein [candidate division KSB1 bacterium]